MKNRFHASERLAIVFKSFQFRVHALYLRDKNDSLKMMLAFMFRKHFSYLWTRESHMNINHDEERQLSVDVDALGFWYELNERGREPTVSLYHIFQIMK